MASKVRERRGPGRPPTGRERLTVVLSMKGRPEWRAALDTMAERLGLSVAELIDLGLSAVAKAKRLPPLPPRVEGSPER